MRGCQHVALSGQSTSSCLRPGPARPRAAGVVVPFGVRAVWRVRGARDVERQLHQYLSRWRVRADREFFELDCNEAFPLIRDLVADHRLEI